MYFDKYASINFESYKVFYQVAKLSSTTQAAESLFLTQPAVSKSIHHLEEELGCSLFLRNQKGMTLTEEGRELYRYISTAYENIMAGQKRLWQMKNLESGTLRVGADEMTVHYALLPRLERFNQKYPKIKMELYSYTRPGLLKALREGEIDFGAVMSLEDELDNLVRLELNTVSYSFIAGPSYGHLSGCQWSLEDILQYPIISLAGDMSARKHLDSFFLANGLIFKPDIELTTTTLIVPFAERNLGVGIVARNFAEDALAAGRVIELQVKPSIPHRKTCIITDPRNAMSLAGSQFLSEFAVKAGNENKL